MGQLHNEIVNPRFIYLWRAKFTPLNTPLPEYRYFKTNVELKEFLDKNKASNYIVHQVVALTVGGVSYPLGDPLKLH